jgi:hypothetical protein
VSVFGMVDGPPATTIRDDSAFYCNLQANHSLHPISATQVSASLCPVRVSSEL